MSFWVSPWAICWRHVAANITGVLIAQTTVNFGYALVDLFAYPTIRTLAERLSPAPPLVEQTAPNEERAAAGIDRLRRQRLRKQAVV